MLLLLRHRLNFMMNIRCFQRSFSAASLAPVQLPSPMEAHLWYILPNEVKNASLLNQYLEILSPCEKENVFRMRGDQLQRRALLARALVRTTIARYHTNSQVEPRSLKFNKNIYGKPEVEWQDVDGSHIPPLHFNISHTSSMIACGVTVNSAIGIDVEEKQRKLKNNILAFARRYFSPYEVGLLTAISDPEFQRQEFIKLWTLKEAYVKALGRGFSAAPFKTFTIPFRTATGGHLSEHRDSEVEVHHARSIEEIFDDISYKKGSAVIRMLQGYLGDDMFQKSLSLYIKRYAGKNAKTEDLWCVLSEESGLQINSMMDDWTKKNGYPVISVKSKDDILEFEQSQFLSSGLCGDGLWIVPITVSIGSYIKCKTFLLEKKSQKLDISELVHSPHQNKSTFNEKNEEKCDEHFWVKVNIEQSGFYRVKYEDKLAARLRKAIESNCLSATDKFGVLDDTYALCVACE